MTPALDAPARGRPRREDIRTAILDAAVTLVLDRGYAAVTTADIAARAGAGKQTLYRWWPSKSALVLDVLENRAGVPDPALPLPAFLATACRTATASAPLLRSLLAEAQSDPGLRVALRDRLVAPHREALRVCLGAIGLSGRGREIAAEAIGGAIWQRLLLGEPLDEGFVDAMVCLAEGMACLAEGMA